MTSHGHGFGHATFFRLDSNNAKPGSEPGPVTVTVCHYLGMAIIMPNRDQNHDRDQYRDQDWYGDEDHGMRNPMFRSQSSTSGIWSWNYTKFKYEK